VIAEVDSLITVHPSCHVLLAGDFNTDLQINNSASIVRLKITFLQLNYIIVLSYFQSLAEARMLMTQLTLLTQLTMHVNIEC